MRRANHITAAGKKAVVLGNGGAAQAIKAALVHENVSELVVVGHRVMKEGVITYEECFEKHGDAAIIVNTSPVGMYPNVDASPVDLRHFPRAEAVLDIIYNPSTTRLTAQAKSLGIAGITGLEMLIAQAKYAVEIFLDTHIPESEIDRIYQKMITQS